MAHVGPYVIACPVSGALITAVQAHETKDSNPIL